MVECDSRNCEKGAWFFISKQYINVKVNQEVHELLKQESDRKGESMAHIVRIAIRRYLKERGLLKWE